MKQYDFKINGNGYNVVINSISGNIADVTVNGTSYMVELADAPAANAAVPTLQQTTTAPAEAAKQPVPATKPAGNGKPVESPLEGIIISVNVNVGDAVKAGQTVAILEAMKMENEIQAESDGTITAVNVSKGEHISVGAAIVTIG